MVEHQGKLSFYWDWKSRAETMKETLERAQREEAARLSRQQAGPLLKRLMRRWA